MESADRNHYPSVSETDPPLMTPANLSGPPKVLRTGREALVRPGIRMGRRKDDT